MNAPLLRLASISKCFPGVQALDNITFTLGRGEIRCLVGENGSGKSTLNKIIAGVETPESGGQIELDGKPIRNWRSTRAIRSGIEVIYQDLSLFPNLTVAENIALVQLAEEKTMLVNWRRVRRIAEAALARIDASIDPEARVGRLPLSSQQLVAIARALTRNVRLLIMDEPTTSLTRREVNTLFSVIKQLQAREITILFVSHKLDEVFEIAERVTVLRDGKLVGTYPSGELSADRLAQLMSGRVPDHAGYRYNPTSETPALQLKTLNKKGHFHDVNLSLFPGEIVGLAGLKGAGRAALALSLFGLSPPDSGQLRIDGEPRQIRSVEQAVQLGIALVPEDRSLQGLVMSHSVGCNAVLTVLDRLRNRWGLLPPRRMQMAMADTTESMAVRTESVDAPAETLSGGNQQRLVLAKWLATRPRILILIGPTVGIDIAAKSDIHRIVQGLAHEGMSILMISDEIPELLANCNRVLLMSRGTIAREWEPSGVSEAEVRRALLET